MWRRSTPRTIPISVALLFVVGSIMPAHATGSHLHATDSRAEVNYVHVTRDDRVLIWRDCAGEGAELPCINGNSLVRMGPIAAWAPPPGHFTLVVATGNSGERRMLIETDTDGRTYLVNGLHGRHVSQPISQPPPVSSPTPTPLPIPSLLPSPEPTDGAKTSPERPCQTCPPPCKDRRFSTVARWESDTSWRLNTQSIPKNLDRGGVAREVRRAAITITRSTNSCGLGDKSSFDLRYEGKTPRITSFGKKGVCGSRYDGLNQVDFGPFGDDSGGTKAGEACVTGEVYSDGERVISEGDVRFNVSFPWSLNARRFCRQNQEEAADLQSAAAHEFGHVAGLWHAAEKRGVNNLTMSLAMLVCTNNARTLGLGDVRALARLY